MIVVIGETKKHLTSATNNSKFWQSWPLGQFLVELHIIPLGLDGNIFGYRHFSLQLEERNASVRSGIWHLHLTFKNTFTVFGVHQVGWRRRQGKFVEMLIWVEAATVSWRLFHLATSKAMDKGTSWEKGRCSLRTDGLLQEAGSMFYKAPARGSFAEGFVQRERNGSNVVTQHGFERISHNLKLLWFWNK